MISRSASGRTAERRPEYWTSQRATIKRMKSGRLDRRADARGAQAGLRHALADREPRVGLLVARQPALGALGEGRAVLEAVARTAAHEPDAAPVLGVGRDDEVHVARDLVLAG